MKPQPLGDSAAFRGGNLQNRRRSPRRTPPFPGGREFSVANRRQRSYTLDPRRTVSAPGRRSAWPFPESPMAEGLARISASLGCGTFHRLDEFSALLRAERAHHILVRHIGRGRMTTGSTKPDALLSIACAFVIARPPAPHLASSARLSGAVQLNPSAAHGMTHRRPVRRSRIAGARRPGASLYGYQTNAGGRQPPGRNTDRRYQR